jgi:transcriptional regulator GlxA family with amidase domain
MARAVATIAQLQRARQLIDDCFDQPLDLEAMARAANLSPWHFLRLFRQAYDRTPHQYLQVRRLSRAQELLLRGRHSVTDVCFAVGFESLGSFSSLFHRALGYPPAVYRTRRLVAVPSIVAPPPARASQPRGYVPGCFMLMRGEWSPPWSSRDSASA